MKSKRSKATDIKSNVRTQVLKRDKHQCIYCGRTDIELAHFIPRSKGGLGIEQNLACVCVYHHRLLDQSTYRNEMLQWFKSYLYKYYPQFSDDERLYKKWQLD